MHTSCANTNLQQEKGTTIVLCARNDDITIYYHFKPIRRIPHVVKYSDYQKHWFMNRQIGLICVFFSNVHSEASNGKGGRMY